MKDFLMNFPKGFLHGMIWASVLVPLVFIVKPEIFISLGILWFVLGIPLYSKYLDWWEKKNVERI